MLDHISSIWELNICYGEMHFSSCILIFHVTSWNTTWPLGFWVNPNQTAFKNSKILVIYNKSETVLPTCDFSDVKVGDAHIISVNQGLTVSTTWDPRDHMYVVNGLFCVAHELRNINLLVWWFLRGVIFQKQVMWLHFCHYSDTVNVAGFKSPISI